MAKYKVGDKVQVRSDLVLSETYGGAVVTGKMMPFLGKEVTISYVDNSDGTYHIEEIPYHWRWTDEMFEGLAEEPEFHVYDTVKHEKYGLGTIIDLGRKSKKTGRRTLKIEFNHWDEDFPNYDENIIWLDSNKLTVIQSYSPN